ncbi:MAG: hypothetical protein ACI9E4_000884, partial [Pseudohongiellaceae bacterium]
SNAPKLLGGSLASVLCRFLGLANQLSLLALLLDLNLWRCCCFHSTGANL